MTRYIIHAASGGYLTANGSWTHARKEALCFDDIFTAVRFCVQQRLEDTELLIHFEDGEDFDIHLPNWRDRNGVVEAGGSRRTVASGTAEISGL
jgi:hypothetical protein